jgi:hypothetical protein
VSPTAGENKMEEENEKSGLQIHVGYFFLSLFFLFLFDFTLPLTILSPSLTFLYFLFFDSREGS